MQTRKYLIIFFIFEKRISPVYKFYYSMRDLIKSLTGAPRLLQSIAKDGIVPFLAPMAAGKPGSLIILLTIIIYSYDSLN